VSTYPAIWNQRQFVGFPDDWHLRLGNPSVVRGLNHRHGLWLRASGAERRQWASNPKLTATGMPILPGDALHLTPLAERLALWKKEHRVLPRSR
jgi:acyl-homoserine lactone acylase PvdQ